MQVNSLFSQSSRFTNVLPEIERVGFKLHCFLFDCISCDMHNLSLILQNVRFLISTSLATKLNRSTDSRTQNFTEMRQKLKQLVTIETMPDILISHTANG